MRKKLKKLLSLVLTVAMALTLSVTVTMADASAAENVWDGTADTSWYNTTDTTFTLTTPEQLAGLAQIVNSNTDTFKGKTIYLGADMYLNESEVSSSTDSSTVNMWTPIAQFVSEGGMGTAGSGTVYTVHYFEGTFDGRGHMIYNMYISHLSSSDDYLERNGLFAMNMGTIQNVGVTGYVGSFRNGSSICGWNLGTIQFCYGGCEIDADGGGGRRGTGGIAGSNAGIIRYCRSDANVYNAYRRAGGIVGYNVADYEFDGVSYTGRVNNCVFTGYAESANTGYSGSIAATNEGTITDCYYLANSSKDGCGVTPGYDNGAVTYEFDTSGVLTDDGTTSVLTAVNGPTSAFAAGSGSYPVLYWEVSGYDFSTQTDKTVTVEQPAAGGTVTATPSGTVAWGTEITLSQETADGYKFLGYSVNGVTITNNYITVTDDVTVTALYQELTGAILTLENTDVLTLSAVDSDGNAITSGERVAEGEVVTVTASIVAGQVPENADYDYNGKYLFTAGDTALNTTAAESATYTMTAEAVTITATADMSRKQWVDLADTSWYNTTDTTFTLTTAEQLAGVQALVEQGETFYGKTILLGNDIDLTNPDGTGGARNWTAIGSQTNGYKITFYGSLGELDADGFAAAQEKYGYLYRLNDSGSYSMVTTYEEGTNYTYYYACYFRGTFDGQGHAVRNLTFNSDLSEYYGAGLFGNIYNATIRNVTVTGSIESTRSQDYIGGIVAKIQQGAAEGTTISNCTNYIEIHTNASSYSGSVGGIVGTNYNTTSGSAIVSSCVNYADITAEQGRAGGIFGEMGSGTVQDCMNFGAITGRANLGGIAFRTYNSTVNATVERCGNEGAITASITGNYAAANVGGILGIVASNGSTITINECYNAAKINSGGGHSAGGIVGNSTGYTTITNSYNAGEIESQYTGGSSTVNNNGIGGIVGQNKSGKSTIGTNCYNRGTINYTGTLVSGRHVDLGGIVGLNNAYSTGIVTTGYYLDTSCENGYGYNRKDRNNLDIGDVSGITSMTSEEMLASDFVTTLGSSYKAAATINDLYPILQWQTDAERYTVTAAEAENGTCYVSTPLAYAGDTVTVTFDADLAYVIDTVGYYTTDASSVTEITADADGVYSFTMPAADTTVVCTFKEDPTVVCTVFGTDLTMLKLLTYATTADVTDSTGTTVSCTGITLSDIFANYVAAPEDLVSFTVTNHDGDYYKYFDADQASDMMLAWKVGTIDTSEDYEVRLVVNGTARGYWVNDVGTITQRFPVFTYTDGTVTDYIFESDIEAVTPVNTTLSYTSGGGTKEVTADFYSVTDLLNQIDIELPDSYCSLTLTAGDGFLANVADQTVPNLYVYQTDSGDWRSAIDGTAGRYWVKDVETITLNTDHSYDENHICTLCGEEETYFTLTYGDTSAKVYVSTIESAGTEMTLSYTAQGTEQEITAVFADLGTLAGEVGITMPGNWCYTTVTSSDGYTKNVIHTRDLYFYVTESGVIRSAIDGSGASMWVSDVATAVVTKDHTYEDHVCTVCGDAEPSMTVSVGGETATVYASDILSVGEEATMSYSSSGGTKEVTTQFAAIEDLVTQAGLTMPEDYCYVSVTATDGFNAAVLCTSDLYFYLTDANQIRSAVDGSAGRYWVNDVVSAEVVTEHTYEGTGHICTVCGTETADPSACPAANFTDLPDYPKWSHKAIDYVYVNGIMNGTSSTTFTPYGEVTRAQVMQVLYKMSGEEGVAYAGIFTDVSQDNWYTDAVAWAASRGIASGYTDGTFRPNESVSRQQLAVFLYRYAAYKGIDVTAQADLSAYTDQSDISSYATTAVSWAVAEGYISGTSSTTLSPQGTATRVQMAAILQRFLENQ